MDEASRLLTVKETCKYLRISAPTLYRMLERRELVSVKIGKRTLFDKKDLDALIDGAKGVPPRKPRPVRQAGQEVKRDKKEPRATKAKSKAMVEPESKPETVGKEKPAPKPKEEPKPKPLPDTLF